MASPSAQIQELIWAAEAPASPVPTMRSSPTATETFGNLEWKR